MRLMTVRALPVAGALALAQHCTVNHTTASADSRQAIGDNKPGIVMWVKFQIGGFQSQLM